MDLNSLGQNLQSAVNQSGEDLQQAMNGDMTNPEAWMKVQKSTAQYTNEIGMQSALISDFKGIFQSIVQKM
jgi:type III secretion apparatus needle protein